MAKQKRQNRGSETLVAALSLSAQSANQVTSGNAGFYSDGTNTWHVAPDGTVTLVGKGAGFAYPAVRVVATALPNAPAYSSSAHTWTASANAALVLDGKTLSVGDRFLLVAGTSGDGLFIVTAAGAGGGGGSHWVAARDASMDASSLFVQGAFIAQWDTSATTYKGTLWQLSFSTPFTMDTTTPVFTQTAAAVSFNAVKVALGAASSAVDMNGQGFTGLGALTPTKEVDHVVKPATSTSANTAGAQETVQGATGVGSGAGGKANLVGGTGGATGAGGDSVVAGGAAGGGNTNGGNAVIKGGAKQGGGTNGTCEVGTDATTSQVNIGSSTAPTSFGGKRRSATTANLIADPGNAGAIPVTDDGVCALTSNNGGGETRTIAAPGYIGQRISVCHDVKTAGNIVITSAVRIDSSAHTQITLSAAGQAVHLTGIQVAGVKVWSAQNDGAALA